MQSSSQINKTTIPRISPMNLFRLHNCTHLSLCRATHRWNEQHFSGFKEKIDNWLLCYTTDPGQQMNNSASANVWAGERWSGNILTGWVSVQGENTCPQALRSGIQKFELNFKDGIKALIWHTVFTNGRSTTVCKLGSFELASTAIERYLITSVWQ